MGNETALRLQRRTLAAVQAAYYLPTALLLGAGAAAGLGLIDVIYVSSGRISPVYLLDAAVQLPMAVAWFLSDSTHRRSVPPAGQVNPHLNWETA